MITFFAAGVPAPQGSKRIGKSRRTGRPLILEDCSRTKPWRDRVAKAANDAVRASRSLPFFGPVSVQVEFCMPRPKRVRRPACDVKPDVDKLVRAILDAITIGEAIRDDAQVVRLTATKRYVRESGIEMPGALISIEKVEQTEKTLR